MPYSVDCDVGFIAFVDFVQRNLGLSGNFFIIKAYVNKEIVDL